MHASRPTTRCPLCGSEDSASREIFTQEKKGRVLADARECRACGLLYLSDYAADRSAIYDGDYGAWGGSDADTERLVADAKRRAFRAQLDRLAPFREEGHRRLLDVGTGNGYLMDVAADLGFEAYGVELSADAAAKAEERHPGRLFVGTLEAAAYSDAAFDVVTLTDIIEHIADPKAFFRSVARVLRPGGLIFIITPDAASWSRRLLGKRWFQYKYEHVTYWSPGTLRRLFAEEGFVPLRIEGNLKEFTLSYYDRYFRKYSFLPPFDGVFRAVFRLLPERLKETSFANPVTGELLAIAKKK